MTAPALFWGSFLLFAGFALAVYLTPYMIYPWDVWLTNTLQLSPQVVTEPLMRLVSAPGYFFVPTLLAIVALGIWLVIKKQPEDALWLTLASLSGMVVSMVLKPRLHRPRPSGSLIHLFAKDRGFGFPSGHVLTYVTIYGCIFWMLRKHTNIRARLVKALCVFFITLIGPSRIYLGSHWASDVLASYALGFVMLSSIYWLLQKNNPNFSGTL
jgi:membrane-associated phospholipid phosphatase